MNLTLLLFSVSLLFFLFFFTSQQVGPYTRCRKSFALSLIANGVLVFVYTEFFSAFNALNSTSIVIFWLSVLAVLVISIYKIFRNKNLSQDFLSLRDTFFLKGLDKVSQGILIATLVTYVVPLLFLAVYAPPNNFDAHSYHLNRILFWIDNGNVKHFPTEHIQQLYHNVFAEYLDLNTILLVGSDRFVGLIQFGAFIGSLGLISLLAKNFGIKANGQLLAAIILLTLPIGIFESTSAQVDYVSCFFFIAFVYFGLELLQKRTTINLFAFLISLSLGAFAKYTILIFALPVTIYFAILIIKKYHFLYASMVCLLATGLLLITFSPFLYRNYSLFGDVMSPAENSRLFSEKIASDEHSVLFSLSGIIKNAGLHLGMPNTHFNQIIDKNIQTIHSWIGVNVNEPKISLDHFSVRYSVHEDMTPNTIHFWLIFLASISLLFVRQSWSIKWIWICALIGFALFCSLLKFQLWSSRTHMPVFAIGSLVVAFMYSKVLQWRISYLSIPLLLLSSVFVYGNPNKPLLPLSYLTRKAIGHIPIYVCEVDMTRQKLLKQHLADYYDFSKEEWCHPLKSQLNYPGRVKVFKILDELDYFRDDKNTTLFKTNRIKSYFLSHMDNYYSFKPLLDRIEGDHKNIGVLVAKGSGFYHYWSTTATKLKNPGQMHYIRYKKEFAALENAQKQFCYDYILCDDLNLLQKDVPKENIKQIYRTNLLYLVLLKATSCKRDLY